MKTKDNIGHKVPSQSIRDRVFKIEAKKVGLSPGTLTFVGNQKTEKPIITLVNYSPDHLETHADISIEESAKFIDESSVSWINLHGIHDTRIVEQFGQQFGINSLSLEDILNTLHRPKIDEMEEYCLVILKMLYFNDESQTIQAEQISLILGQHFVITFQEHAVHIFDGVRERLQRSKGRIRQRGPDYLVYALIDSVVDNYFHVLEKAGDSLTLLEEDLISDPDQETLTRVQHYKRELLLLRKSVWPLREVISKLYREESPFIKEGTQAFLRDLNDHVNQVIDTEEIFLDTVSGLQDLYIQTAGNRLNEIMKVLTIMASIFIPLTFIAGVYGMNFENMPELEWHWAYYGVWAFMIFTVIGMLFYFKSKKWL